MQRKQIKGMLLFPLIIILFVGVLTSCDDFFTTSWGSWAARDMSKMDFKVSADNIDDLMDKAANNKKMQAAILDSLVDAVKKAEGEDKKKLQNAGVDLALSCTNVMDTVLNSMAELESLVDNDGDIGSYVAGLVDSMDNLSESTDALLEIIPLEDVDSFVTANNATNSFFTAILLISAVAEEQGQTTEEFFNELTGDNGSDMLTALNDPKVALALALADAASEKMPENSQFGMLADVMKDLNLTTE